MRTPFKLRSSGPFKDMGSSPVKQDDDKKEQKVVSLEDYKANVDSLQAFQHQNLGKPDPVNTGLELYTQNYMEDKYGPDSPQYKSFKSAKRVHGDETDFKTADKKLKGHPISSETYHRATDKYWNAKIKK